MIDRSKFAPMPRRPSRIQRRMRVERKSKRAWAAADHIITTLVILWWVFVAVTSTFHPEKLLGGSGEGIGPIIGL